MKREVERRTSVGLTLDLDRLLVEIENAFHNGQAKASMAGAGGTGTIDLVESVEDAGHSRFWNAASVIADGGGHGIPVALQRDSDSASFGCVPNRIFNQVVKHTVNERDISRHQGKVAWAIVLDSDLCHFSGELKFHNDV